MVWEMKGIYCSMVGKVRQGAQGIIDELCEWITGNESTRKSEGLRQFRHYYSYELVELDDAYL